MMGSRSAPMVTPSRPAFLSCLQNVTADICNNLTPAPIHSYAADRASVRQKKTGRPVKFELTEATRQALDDYLTAPARSQATVCSRAVEN